MIISYNGLVYLQQVIFLLAGDMHKLRNVILTINPFTDCLSIPVDPRIWKLCRKNNPNLRIHLLTEGKRTKEVVFQEGAPVKSIVYDSSHVKVSLYTQFLCVFCIHSLQIFFAYTNKVFLNRFLIEDDFEFF